MNEFEFKLEPGKKLNKQETYIEKEPIILIVLENIFATMIDDGVFKSIFDR